MDTDLLILAYERGSEAGNLDLARGKGERQDVWAASVSVLMPLFYTNKYPGMPVDTETVEAMADAFQEGYSIVFS